MSGELTGLQPAAVPAFVEVEMSREAAPPPLLSHVSPAVCASSLCVSSSPAIAGQIGIVLPSGVRLTVDANVDADVLGQVLAVLGR